MTTELLCLMIVAILAASLWLPFIIGVNMLPADPETPDVFIVPRDPLTLPPWIARSYRAHQNLLEQFAPFAVVVLITHVIEQTNAITAWACIAFVILRMLHAVGMITGVACFPVRPTIFTLGNIAILVIAWQVFA